MHKEEISMPKKPILNGRFWGNFISVGWSIGGLIFLTANSPKVWRVIAGAIDK